jgi:acyl carrier protein
MNVSQGEIISIFDDAGIAADVSKLKSDTSLRTAGVDSLDLMNILLQIEEKYGVKIPDEVAAELDSIDHIVSYLHRL